MVPSNPTQMPLHNGWYIWLDEIVLFELFESSLNFLVIKHSLISVVYIFSVINEILYKIEV